jgi:hypothetical protein
MTIEVRKNPAKNIPMKILLKREKPADFGDAKYGPPFSLLSVEMLIVF